MRIAHHAIALAPNGDGYVTDSMQATIVDVDGDGAPLFTPMIG